MCFLQVEKTLRNMRRIFVFVEMFFYSINSFFLFGEKTLLKIFGNQICSFFFIESCIYLILTRAT